jgi:septal ring-binding cell division protein DamX
MMKIQKNKSKTRYYILTIVLVVLLLAIGVGTYWYKNHSKSDTPSSSPATKEQIDNGNSTKKATVDRTSPAQKPSNSDTPPSPVEGKITASIPYADSKRLTVLIDGILNGTCSLELTNGASKITKTAPVQSGPSSSTCQGFSYDALSPGEWTATVTITNADSTGTATRSIMVE